MTTVRTERMRILTGVLSSALLYDKSKTYPLGVVILSERQRRFADIGMRGVNVLIDPLPFIVHRV